MNALETTLALLATRLEATGTPCMVIARLTLDLEYLRPRIQSLAEALHRPQMTAEFDRLLAGPRG